MKKNLVVCGVDGSGKTTLIGQLLQWYPQLGEVRRACTSEGPIADTVTWTTNDLFKSELGVYDRHPLVSDRVYPLVLGMRPKFADAVPLAQMTEVWARRTVIIFCDPGLRVVHYNIATDQGVQMTGVRDFVQPLYQRYHEVMATLEDVYGIVVWRYNYRQPSNELPCLRAFIEKVVL